MSSRTGTNTWDNTEEQAGSSQGVPSQEPPTELKFFFMSDPAEAKTPNNKKLVRSHVARTSHAKYRHARSMQREKTVPDDVGNSARVSRGNGQEAVEDGQRYPDEEVLSSSMPLLSASSPSSQTPLGGLQTIPSGVDLDGSSRGATKSVIRHLSPWERFLVDHYVNVLIPSRHNPCDHPRHPMDLDLYRKGMITHWVPFCLTDMRLLQGIFLASCQNLIKLQYKADDTTLSAKCEEQALLYRGECLRSIYEAMPTDGVPVTDNAIAMVLFLSFNECMAGEIDQAKRHMAACEHMIELKGGYEKLGLNGFLSQLIVWFKAELSSMGNMGDEIRGD